LGVHELKKILVAGVVGSLGIGCVTTQEEDAWTGSGLVERGSPGSIGQHCPIAALTPSEVIHSFGSWKPPAPRSTPPACSDEDLARFRANVAGAEGYDATVAGLPPGCARCLLSRFPDPQWQVLVADVTGTAGRFNGGACHALAPGGSLACGQAVYYYRMCRTGSCDYCATDEQYRECSASPAVKAACLAAHREAIEAACPTGTALQDLDAACKNLENAAKVVCGPS
jgi:hypothetical protein